MTSDGLKVRHAMQFLREAQIDLARGEPRLASQAISFAIARFEELFHLDMPTPETIEQVVAAAREFA